MNWDHRISDKASFYGDIKIGENVRIDDYCILTGNIQIGNHIHIAAYSFLSGTHGIVLEDYVQLAPRVTILTASDDYSGSSLVGPTIPGQFKPDLDTGPVTLKRHALLGACTVIMPGVVLYEGACTGAFTFVKRDLKPWSIYAGCPAKFIKARSKLMLKLQTGFERQWRKYAE